MLNAPDFIARVFLFALAVALASWAVFVYIEHGVGIAVAMLTFMCLLTLCVAITSREKIRQFIAVLLDP